MNNWRVLTHIKMFYAVLIGTFLYFQLKRSQVQGHSGLHADSLVSRTRTSKTGWLPDSFHPVVEQVTDRSSQITKLNANTWRDESELLQVSIFYYQ